MKKFADNLLPSTMTIVVKLSTMPVTQIGIEPHSSTHHSNDNAIDIWSSVRLKGIEYRFSNICTTDLLLDAISKNNGFI